MSQCSLGLAGGRAVMAGGRALEGKLEGARSEQWCGMDHRARSQRSDAGR